MRSGAGFQTIDDYNAMFPKDIQTLLETMRATIHAAAPEATEKISYQMPTFYQQGNLVHFAALKSHIGFYPTPSAIAAFQEELAKYVSTKGALHFPLDEPLPLDLITKIVKFRVAENLARSAAKTRKRKA